MSMGSHLFAQLPQGPGVLGELLHSLSQPLTSLHCSLQLSLDRSVEEVTGQQQSIAAALQQTERVIGMIRLMREYLDAEQTGTDTAASAVMPVLRNVIEDMVSIAAVRGTQLRLEGTCSATLAVPEPRLRLALQYLTATMIDAQGKGGKITFLLAEGPAGAVLRVEGGHRYRPQERSATKPPATLRRARLAIAARVLEGAGASLVVALNDIDPVGFVLRIPRPVAAPE